MTKLHELNQHGQSVWLDYIRRQFIENGGLQQAVDEGVRGVTSNPAIFEKAIAGSDDYDEQLRELAAAGHSIDAIYEALAVEDIQRAADILRPVYDESDGADGYVSLEVNPTLARDTDGTIAEARHLYKKVNRPNVMIKVPATPAGIPAIETLISDGININVTLMFSLADYDAVAEAYISGLEKLAASGGDVSKVASVASFFVSRVESIMDDALEAVGTDEAAALMGKIAVANTRVTYVRFKEVFSGERWQTLADQGARVQRPLWASTSTKNPAYSDVKYVEELIAPDTVNTMPPDTRDAFMDHGTVAITIENDLDDAHAALAALADVGVDYDALTQQLQDEGVEKFEKPFASLMESLQAKVEAMRDEPQLLDVRAGAYDDIYQAALNDLRDQNVIARIWQHDHTIWKDEPTEITNRLGWLTIMDTMEQSVSRMQHLAQTVKADGLTDVLLLGMGGSSLAPEVFDFTFGTDSDGLKLHVLDSTDPGAVLAYEDALDLDKTLFIVATKSGGTAETLSFFKYFYNRVLENHDNDYQAAGQHFVGITDPGSKLESIGDRFHFRTLFLNDPNIGGRYSVLSFFGLVPAALIGVDLETLLQRAQNMATHCEADNCPSEGDNSGGRLGALMGELAGAGRDKITLLASPAIAHFGDWVEQLIAESTGKEGKGILPVVGESVGAPAVYGDDRLFVYMRVADDKTYDDAIAALEAAGHPVVIINLSDTYDLGGQFFLWEMATAVASQRLQINPFDQPNVEAAKKSARAQIEAYQETGKLPTLEPTLTVDGIELVGDIDANSLAEALAQFLGQAETGAYISLQAYVQPTEAASDALQTLQSTLRDQTKLATTLGYGPRFLHSTGQLHKGDSGKGLFIQFTQQMPQDAPIPDEAGDTASSMRFGTLKEAQALGDRQALLDANRHVLRIQLTQDVVADLNKITAAI